VQFRFDPTRIAAQIVTGIGFLGAGAIIRYGMSVRGLTTAASLWVVAAIGTAVGLGGYLLGGVTTGITLLALFGLKPLRSRLVRGLRREQEEYVVEAADDLGVDRLVADLASEGIQVNHLRIEEEAGDDVRNIVLFLTLPTGRTPEEAAGFLSRMAGVRNVDWTR
jgi:putative Mg2+ transporter-C (MgtC) family protein